MEVMPLQDGTDLQLVGFGCGQEREYSPRVLRKPGTVVLLSFEKVNI